MGPCGGIMGKSAAVQGRMPKPFPSSTHGAERSGSSDPRRDVDDEHFIRTGASSKRGYPKPPESESVRRRDGARGDHDDQGGSRQPTGRDRHAAREQERSDAQLQQGNFGGQDSRDQSPEARFAGQGAREASPSEAAAQRGETDELDRYASDTRDNFSRMYAEHQRREAAKREAGNGE